MPRFRRLIRPGTLIHIIVRFHSRRYVLDDDVARDEYLNRAGRAFSESDWRALSYALMGTHTHFAAIAGEDPFCELSRGWHCGFARWSNNRTGGVGSVLANRPKTFEWGLKRTGKLLAYQHNNPVRAGAAPRAVASTWTSHRFYCGIQNPEWLEVGLGLELAGFARTPAGRASFAEFVNDSVADQGALADSELLDLRSEARVQSGSAVELTYPKIAESGISTTLWTPEGASLRERWPGDLRELATFVASRCGLELSHLQSQSRERSVVRARRLAIVCAREQCNRQLTEIAAIVGISLPSARGLQRRASTAERDLAAKLATKLKERKS